MELASPPTPFTLRTKVRRAAVVAVLGELDCDTALRLREVLDRLAEPGRVVLVDLADTEFLDCAGIGVLATCHQRQRQLGGELLLDSPRPAVSRVLKLTEVDTMITVLRRREERSFQGEVLSELSPDADPQ
jgi:anti-sigma B factor antagonist